MFIKVLVIALFLFLPSVVSAHDAQFHTEAETLQHGMVAEVGELYSDLEEKTAALSFQIVTIAAIALALLTFISLSLKKLSKGLKKFLFISIALVTILPTIYLAVSTVYINSISSSKGPVHWHADYEVWACGKELDLIDPVGLSNKIGTATLHEHNDKRIHLEGVAIKPHDASLGKYMMVIGGHINQTSFSFPLENQVAKYSDGEMCPNGDVGKLQVFAYKVIDNYYYQQKVSHPADYIISGESQVPNGDCIIIEFGPDRDRTDKLCLSYKAALETGKLKGVITR